MQTQFTMDELKAIGRIVGGVSGFLVGLIPIFVGRRYGKAWIGVVGLAACIVGGIFYGLLLSLPLMAIALVIIIRLGSKKVTAAAYGEASPAASGELTSGDDAGAKDELPN